MASAPPKNLFGGGAPSPGVGGGTGRAGTGGGGATGSDRDPSAGAAAAWFEEDDESLLSRLLLGGDDGDEGVEFSASSVPDGGGLDARLDRLRARLDEDLSRLASGDGWWASLLDSAGSSGFSRPSFPSASSSSSALSAAAKAPGAAPGGTGELPKSFLAPEGRAHLRAVADLLGVSRERATRITLASLRTFARVAGAPPASPAAPSAATAPENDSDKENDDRNQGDDQNKENDDDGAPEREAKLRSLLGTRELFRRVLLLHRRQFLARLRAITESLRLEQEREGKRGSVGKSCATFLDKLDAALSLDGKRRGLFRTLLRLAAGPPLPGMGAGELPRSVDELLCGNGGTASDVLEGGEEALLAIRNESAEALLALLYDRIDGGASRTDLFLVLEAAGACRDCEFGTSATACAAGGRGRYGMVPGGGGRTSSAAEDTRRRLDGLWALICAECVGLWRSSGGNDRDLADGGGGWVRQHPLLPGLTLVDAGPGAGGKRGAGLSLHTGDSDAERDPDGRARRELEALCGKLRELGETVRDRRQAAYIFSRKRARSGDPNAMEATDAALDGDHDDDELWGARAPEAVALLAFGLLLRLAHLSCPTNDFLSKLGECGGEFAQTANDDCGAFAYLHQILEDMVLDPLKDAGSGISRRGRMIGNEKLVRDLLMRGEVEMAVETQMLCLTGEGAGGGAGEGCAADSPAGEPTACDAASTVYASIGREVLSATVRAFRVALLSPRGSSPARAAENVGMLADLAAAIHRHSGILCENFWDGWEEFCRREDEVMDAGGGELLLGRDEPLCYLLDASHGLAATTLEELKQGSEQPQAIIDYLKPLSSFLHLIASLCADSGMVRSVLTSEFLPEGLLASAVSVVAALAPLVSSLNEAANTSDRPMSGEERGTIRRAAAVVRSVSTLAHLGGPPARDWIRASLSRGDSTATATPARAICDIALQVVPGSKQNSLDRDSCAALVSSALNLLVDLLVDSDIAFQTDTLACFSSPINSSNFGRDGMSGFAQFVVSGGMHSEVTLAAMSVLNCLSVTLARNMFDATSVSSGLVPAHIETMGSGVMVALDALSSLVSSGEVSFPTSKLQAQIAHAILSSAVATLISLKQVIYLHEDDGVRSIALAVRSDIMNCLTLSTPLGQAIAFLASAPLSLSLVKKAEFSRELSRAMDAAASYREIKMDGGGKYGAWGRFVTPKRVPQKISKGRVIAKFVASSSENDDAKVDAHSYLDDVVVMAQSLLLVWGELAEEVTASDRQNLLLQNSPCTLLLSKASPSFLQPHAIAADLNVANLNLISTFASAENVSAGGTARSNMAVLSAKIIKMCLRHSNSIAHDGPSQHDAHHGLSLFRVALGGGNQLFQVLLSAFVKLVDGGNASEEDYVEGMEHLALMAIILLETVAVSVSTQPDLARTILLGGGTNENWLLMEKMNTLIKGTSGLISTSRENQTSVDNRVLNLRCLLTCASLHIVSELWKSCRLTCEKNTNFSPDSAHACGIIVSHLTNANKAGSSVIANNVELTRSSMLAIMSTSEKNSLHDEVSTAYVHQKCILLDLLRRSLDIIAVEAVSRVKTESLGGIKFVEDIFDAGPMKCWKFILSGDSPAALAASSWLSFSSSVSRSATWNIASFLQANPAEQEVCTSTWCAFGSAARLAKDLSPDGSTRNTSFRQCNALHVLTQGEASLAASWSIFLEVIMANVITTRPVKEVRSLSSTLVETALTTLVLVSDVGMISESLIASQGFLESRSRVPVEELCSLLLYSLTVSAPRNTPRGDALAADEVRTDCQSILAMIGRLYEAANKLFVMTQLGLKTSEAVCSIRQKLLSCALVLIAEFESLPLNRRTRDDIVKYNDLRISFTDLSVNALQSLQYVQLTDNDNHVVVEDLLPSKYGYGFGSVSENSSDPSHLGQEAALMLLRVALSLISRLAPTTTMGASSDSDYQTYTYGVEFAACLKERRALECIQYHLSMASTVASLTYQAVHAVKRAVHAGISSNSVAVIHSNAVDIICLITTLFHTLIDAGSTIVGILFLLLENRCFQSLTDNPLLRIFCKTLSSSSSVTHRGYYTCLQRNDGIMSSTSKIKPSSQKDPVHFVWREVIIIFSSLLRSARCLSQTYAKVDEYILRQLTPVNSTVLDFVCTYAEELLSCLPSMMNEARTQRSLSGRGGKTKPTSFSSSIQSSSFAFTRNLLKETADISSLFAELCQLDTKNEFEHQCDAIYARVSEMCLELATVMSSFLGSIGNARELFLALSSASSMLDQPAMQGLMFDAHPLLAEGIPNARHEAIRNAHFAHSCCILATAEDFSNSHIATTKAAETGKDKSLEQSFQIQVNNKFVSGLELIAGHCLFNALTVLSNTHPSSDSFISFSNEEASRLDVAAVIMPGTTVTICAQSGAQQHSQRYLVQPCGGNARYARTISCDKSTRTIAVEYADSGSVHQGVPWSWIVGMEDTSKRHCIFSYSPAPKSMAEVDTRGSPSLGHLILALKWCRHVGLASLDNSNSCPMHIVKCVAERAAILLCAEVLLHDEVRDGTPRDDTVRRVNMQLLDLFGYAGIESKELCPKAAVLPHQGDKSLALAIEDDILDIIQMNLKHQLQAACLEREEEQKIWEQNNVGWDNTTWASSSKRQGRRSPFRLMRMSSSGDLS